MHHALVSSFRALYACMYDAHSCMYDERFHATMLHCIGIHVNVCMCICMYICMCTSMYVC